MKKVEEKFDSQSMFKELSVKFGSGSHMELNEEYTQVEERVLKGLVGLRLLKNVPFRYLIPHEDLLPNESIRFFFVDRNWLDALVDGALSVGRIGTRDYAYDERKYDSIMTTLHDMESDERGKPRWYETEINNDRDPPPQCTDTGGTISGFLLRSRAVRDWPSMRVSAYIAPPESDEPWKQRILTLRQERISDTVMLCLFLGTPTHLRIEEPRECLQLGVDVPGEGEDPEVRFRTIDGDEAQQGSEGTFSVPLYNVNKGIINIRDTMANLKAKASGAGLAYTDEQFDSALLSIQFLQFPYQQDFVNQDGQLQWNFLPIKKQVGFIVKSINWDNGGDD